ncbi:TPA: NADPH-dependent oxidoreductase [Candidatus Saccharibacteria bacterium]|nr:NADPH-dependent oxidoreductase [Candidatus Saccharibacteria bacterium]HIO87783.1 NADPH-dependent oxidoreductase [Candidatus Saccharibacteria bacterium]
MKLLIVLGSAREERFGITVANWYLRQAKAANVFGEVELADLATIDLPFTMEPNSPSGRKGQYEYEYTKNWSKIVDSADAYVFLTPEYNHSYSAVLKNALDHIYDEWNHKPAGLVSWGGVGGARAISKLAGEMRNYEIVPVKSDVRIVTRAGDVNESGEIESESADRAVVRQLELLLKYAEALKQIRS